MGFMGILVLAWAAMLIFFIAIFVFVFVFIPCLIIFIINLVKGIKNHWPKRNMTGVITTGIVLSVIVAFMVGFAVMIAVVNNNAEQASPSTSEAAIALCYLLSQINH